MTTETVTTPCVIYAAKSTADKHRSIPDQIRDCRKKSEEEGWEIVGEYEDENFTAFSGNRGPGLIEAQERAAAVAVERGTTCMLVAQHTDRFSRGAGDEPGASDSLTEIWHRMRRQDVHIRSFQNDAMTGDVVLVAVAAKQAHEESKRKSEAVQGGKRRRVVERGETNGPLLFGYRWADAEKRGGRRVPDDREVDAIAELRRQLHDGANVGDLTRWLNANGHMTKAWEKKPAHEFTPPRVRELLRNPYYAGKVKAPDGQLIDGGHAPLYDWAEYERIQSDLEKLGQRAGSAGGRKPAAVELFSGGALKCAHCGRSIYSRKIGSVTWLMCGAVRLSMGTCDAVRFDAASAETALLAHLDSVFIDLDSLVTSATEKHAAERGLIEAEAAKLMAERERLEKLTATMEADYAIKVAEGDNDSARIAAKQAARFRGEAEAATAQLEAVDARLAEWVEDPADTALDWWSKLSAAVKGDIVNADTVEQANAALKKQFSGIYVTAEQEGGPVRFDFVIDDAERNAFVVDSALTIQGDISELAREGQNSRVKLDRGPWSPKSP